MNVAVFSTKPYDREFLRAANTSQHDALQHELTFFEPRLMRETASLARGFEGVCVFVHDRLDRETLQTLHKCGCRLVALRCAGFNNVDLAAAKELKIGVVRVPAYSPYAVAEHAAGMILTLNRKFHRAYNRVHEGNFALKGLLGFDLHGKPSASSARDASVCASSKSCWVSAVACWFSTPAERRTSNFAGRAGFDGTTAARIGHREPALSAE